MKNMKEIGYSSYCVTTKGEIYSLKVNRFLKPVKRTDGYLYLVLRHDNGELKNVVTHRLVAKMFLKNSYKDHLVVNHKDGVKTNNCVDNLEWVTQSYNTEHAHKETFRKKNLSNEYTKLPKEGEVIHDYLKNGDKISTDEDVHKVSQMLQDGYRICDISRMTGFDRNQISLVFNKKNTDWDNITDLYDFYKIKRQEKSSVETVISVCELLEIGLGINEVARQTGTKRQFVSSIKRRKNYESISSSFKF